MKLTSLILSSFLVLVSSFAAEKRPNFLFILVDDQSPFDLKMYNPQSTLETPNIDKLAAQGMVFDGAYHMGSFSGAVCMPSRHMIMSGRTVWHLPPAPWGSKTSPPQLEQQTIPRSSIAPAMPRCAPARGQQLRGREQALHRASRCLQTRR
jgi:choline-sulfatase